MSDRLLFRSRLRQRIAQRCHRQGDIRVAVNLDHALGRLRRQVSSNQVRLQNEATGEIQRVKIAITGERRIGARKQAGNLLLLAEIADRPPRAAPQAAEHGKYRLLLIIALELLAPALGRSR